MNETQHGYLLLADSSGYTSYAASTELTHSQDLLSELLELIIERLKPLLTIAKIEGDAVFAYAPETKISRGESILELIESTYAAFRSCRTRHIVAALAPECDLVGKSCRCMADEHRLLNQRMTPETKIIFLLSSFMPSISSL